MGHNLHAYILKGPFDDLRARSFEMRWVPLTFDLTMFFVQDRWIDAWAERLGIQGGPPKGPLYDFYVVHHMLKTIARESPASFAAIFTDYFGGAGEQAAAVYRGEEVVLESGTINEALRVLGVAREPGKDEFDTVGLGDHRHSSDWFEEE